VDPLASESIDAKPEQQAVLHEGVECDACGECPIKGIRYKCAVRKDYDLCAKCEDSLDHQHPMLKIRKAGGAPSMIVTVLNEQDQPAAPDQECDWKAMKGQFHQMKQQWKAQNPEWKQMKEQWAREHCQNGEKPHHFFKKMVGGFLENMGIDTKEWGCHKGGHGNGHGKQEYKKKRAVVVCNPDVVLECPPGCVVVHEIEVKNNTHWGWKKGCFLGLDNSVEQKGMPIELVNVPVDQKVESMETLKMAVPITVLEAAQPSEQPFQTVLRFRGPKGGEIGEPMPIKIKIVAPKAAPQEAQKPVEEEKKSHLEIVKIAVKLFDTEKLGQTFNEVLEVVTLVNGNEEIAKKSLQPRQ